MTIRKFWFIDDSSVKPVFEAATKTKLIGGPVVMGDFATSPLRDNKGTPILGQITTGDYQDATQCKYVDFPLQYTQALWVIGVVIGKKYSNRAAKKLTYLAAGSKTGNCPDHPTHAGFPPGCIDIQYYTFGQSNYTQWGTPKSEIWDGAGELRANFDVARNAYLIKAISEAWPGLKQVLCHSKIKAALVGHDASLDKVIQADDTPSYNHNTHMHIQLSGEVNKGMVIS